MSSPHQPATPLLCFCDSDLRALRHTPSVHVPARPSSVHGLHFLSPEILTMYADSIQKLFVF